MGEAALARQVERPPSPMQFTFYILLERPAHATEQGMRRLPQVKSMARQRDTRLRQRLSLVTAEESPTWASERDTERARAGSTWGMIGERGGRGHRECLAT